MLELAALVCCVVAAALADIRWLRVAQREHYLPGSVSRFVTRWWYGRWYNAVLWVLALVALVGSSSYPEPAILLAIIVADGPIGLSLRGTTSKLVWTRRLKTLAATVAVMQLAVIGIGALLQGAVFAAALVATLTPTLVDLALIVTAPWERSKAQGFIDQAKKRLSQVQPTIVAITGSYGKTSTKGYVAHLVSGSKTVLPTPASFNNRAGLSRAINEQLAPGTDVFIAEMGTYGHGEISELCEICPPDISVITAIGPVHLERFGSEAAIVKAKSEIFERARVCVLNVDDDRLAFLADQLDEAGGKKVWRCSSYDEQADVCVVMDGDKTRVISTGTVIAEAQSPDAAPSNIACAVAVALELGVTKEDIAARLASLPVAAHRQEISTGSSGVTVIDDTYNANPASVRRGLETLAKSADEGHRMAVVTPGMVELGRRQAYENARFAGAAATVVTDFVIVGHTNRRALRIGVDGTGINVVQMRKRADAVEWVRKNLGEGDAVLYANDLPDHFP